MSMQHRAVIIAVATVAILLTMWHFRLPFMWPAAAGVVMIAAGFALDRTHTVHSVHGGDWFSSNPVPVKAVVPTANIDPAYSSVIPAIRDYFGKMLCGRCITGYDYKDRRDYIFNTVTVDKFLSAMTAPVAPYKYGPFWNKGGKIEIATHDCPPNPFAAIAANLGKKVTVNSKEYPSTQNDSNGIPIEDAVYKKVHSTFGSEPGWANFFLARNTPENDKNWHDSALKEKASMSRYHRFLILRDFNPRTFNILNMDQTHVPMLEAMKECAKAIAVKEINELYPDEISILNRKDGAKPEHIGLFFTCWPHTDINSLHLHIVDLRNTGPAFDYHQAHDNVPIDDVIRVLKHEI